MEYNYVIITNKNYKFQIAELEFGISKLKFKEYDST